MVTNLKKKHFIYLVEFIRENINYDFYLTEDNRRIYIDTPRTLKRFIKTNSDIYVSETNTGIDGVISVWNGKGAGISRRYIKINASCESTANKLITILLGNVNYNKLFVKMKKDSPYIDVFKSKGFKFYHGRGNELLFFRSKTWQRHYRT